MSSSCAFVLCAIAATPRSSPSHMSAVEGEGAAVAVLPYPFVALNTADLSAEQVERSIHIGLELGVSVVDFHLGSSANGVHERDGVARAVKSLGRSALTLITKLDKPPANLTDPSAAAALARREAARLELARHHTRCPHVSIRSLTVRDFVSHRGRDPRRRVRRPRH